MWLTKTRTAQDIRGFMSQLDGKVVLRFHSVPRRVGDRVIKLELTSCQRDEVHSMVTALTRELNLSMSRMDKECSKGYPSVVYTLQSSDS
jgi:hypothetical protein